MNNEELISKIIDCAVTVRRALAPGFLEKVYENALLIELKHNGINVTSQQPLSVKYRDVIVGEYVADLIVEEAVVVEIKAVRTLNIAHEAQLVNYLTITGIDSGLLINFGNENKIEIKRKYRLYKS